MNWNGFDREEEHLSQLLADGAIDIKEFNKRMGDLQREARDAAQEEAEGAYERSMEANGFW